MISAERPSTEHARAREDIDQAAQLLRVLAEERPSDIAPARHAARERRKNWKKRLTKAQGELPQDVQNGLDDLGIERDGD